MNPAPQDDLIQTEILQAALRLYRKFGPDKVGMDDVAKATGRSRTSLYYYFKNRDDVFHAALDAIIVEMAKEIRRAVSEAETFADKIYAFCLTKLRASKEWKLILNTMWSSLNSVDQSKHARATEGLHQKLVFQESVILKEMLTAAADRKEIRTVTPEEQDRWAFVITSGIRGIRNEIADQNLTQQVKATIRLLSNMAAKWLKE